MEQRYRVLFVPGSGDRDNGSSSGWHGSDVGVGLIRGLPAGLVARLDVESSTHEHLLRAALRGSALRGSAPVAPAGRQHSRPGLATNCPCCAKGKFYRWYSDILRSAPGLLSYVETRYVGLLHPEVVRFAGDPQLRAAVRQGVREDLDKVRPDVVVAHSLGSVVAIEALAMSEWSPRLLITAGAPLAWPRFAQTWSQEARLWLSRKSCVWVNLIDMSDQVTGFNVPPTGLYSTALNVVVGNDHYSTLFGPDGGFSCTHSLRHYLRHTAVRDAFLGACA